ncbi:MAG: chemotaxis protein CheC [Synergistaceae bacterium]|nr:chemotaxis protein CheC [Synergistaceae bacterium]MBQ3449873.1 chemotaxis protein CheC [Synergistaceae bacterium]MBQ3695256.1 chemotaxis protein CheC [Synergistaceae bacterium]MBQ6112284.1 chemotaxis protein CheC [Synergistaceae bacterium]MBR0250776.1 chemotaxis protein CheC [Synergistaceae bacterium]
MSDMASFTERQLDAIKEVGNIGTGNAATALSGLLARMIHMDVPETELVSIYELAEHYGDPMKIVGAVFVRSLGGFQCSLIFIQDEEDAKLMVELLLKQQFGTFIPVDEIPQEMTDSALTEVGNIVLSSFLNAINMLLGTQHQISVPGVAHDMLSSILDVVASIYGQMGETALLVNTELSAEGLEEGRKISGHIILIPDPDSLELLLRKLKVL